MKAITFRLPEQELETLQTYCEQEGRNQTDVLREYIRSLKKRIKIDSLRASDCPPIPRTTKTR